MNGNGVIEYSEFLATLMSSKQYLKDNNISMTFLNLDTDCSMQLSFDEIKPLFVGNESITDETIKNFIKEVDLDNDGFIDYKEFRQMMIHNGY